MCLCVFQIPVSPGNWSDSSSFLATISQPEVDSLSTLVSEISVSEHRNSTIATIATVLDVTNSSRSSSGTVTNQTALFEKNTRSQQDQCWETYVGQVRFIDWHSHGSLERVYTVFTEQLLDSKTSQNTLQFIHMMFSMWPKSDTSKRLWSWSDSHVQKQVLLGSLEVLELALLKGHLTQITNNRFWYLAMQNVSVSCAVRGFLL